MTEPRRVRPGELPSFGQVWSWHPNGPKYLCLGLRPFEESRGTRYNFVGLQLLAHPNCFDSTMQWSQPAHVGIGPVLADWYCHDG